jgi:hypothetical protein
MPPSSRRETLLLLGSVLGWPHGASAQQAARSARDTLGPDFAARNTAARSRARPNPSTDLTSAVQRWNRLAIDATGLDHTPPAAGETRVFAQQLGPGRSSRALAIAHLALYDATQSALRAVAVGSRTDLRDESLCRAAVARATHDALHALFPAQRTALAAALDEDRSAIADATALERGEAIGAAAAVTRLAQRSGDGADHAEPRIGVDYISDDGPGIWRQDPVSRSPLALGARWAAVRPFVLESGAQFRLPPPPALASAEYALAFDEVFRLGSESSAERSAEQKQIGIYWAYDGVPTLCAPPRLYNQVASQIASDRRTGGLELARLLTLVNVSMADAGIAAWDSKYHHTFWRPVTAIREAEAGTGPSGLGDGNAQTTGDAGFVPLGAPASNLAGPNFTPPFPAYPSGHAVFGAALFQTLRRFYRTDAIAFRFQSDEYDGVTLDADGTVRPSLTRSFSNLTQAEEENGQSRIYLGIHWAFDKTGGIRQGRRIADYVFDRLRLRDNP